MHINKIHSVRPIALVAQEMVKTRAGSPIAIEREPEDGLIWVRATAVSQFGVGTPQILITIHPTRR